MDPREMAEKCACGERNNVIHAKNCHLGGYVNLRHDAVRDFIHQRATMIFKDTEKEPNLRPIAEQCLNPGANISEEARADITSTDAKDLSMTRTLT